MYARIHFVEHEFVSVHLIDCKFMSKSTQGQRLERTIGLKKNESCDSAALKIMRFSFCVGFCSKELKNMTKMFS